jgi:hypothetical protein
MGTPVDNGDADYGTADSRRLRSLIRSGAIQVPSLMFDRAVSEIYRLEREDEANGGSRRP